MRLLLFRILSPLFVAVFPDKARRGFLRHYHEQQVVLLKRDQESLAAIRPRTENDKSDEYTEQ